ncbi:MAG TPA: hypothetical protein VF062_09200 [Candidatus Limnocylindrales bacterium]
MTSGRGVRRFADTLAAAHSIAQWQDTAQIYRQARRIALDRGKRSVPTDLRDRLAELLCRQSASYGDREAEFAHHGFVVVGNIHGYDSFDAELFQALYLDKTLASGPPYHLPPLMQAVLETQRRMRDVRRLKAASAPTMTAAFVGGSTAYAPHHSVRGNVDGKEPSDSDVLIIVEDENGILDFAKRMIDLPGVDAASAHEMVRQAQIFVDRYAGDDAMFSFRLRMWTGSTPDPMMEWVPGKAEYQISLHIFTVASFRHLLVASSPSLRSELAGEVRRLTDYRAHKPETREVRRTFAGIDRSVPMESEQVDHGWISRPRVYYIDDNDSYCPGLIQIILLTAREASWDRLGVSAEVDQLIRKTAERLAYERERREHLYVSLAHPRYPRFALHRRKELDARFGERC